MKLELVKGTVSPYMPWDWVNMSDKYINKEFPFRWIMDLDIKVDGKNFKLYKDTKNIEITFHRYWKSFTEALDERELARLRKHKGFI